MRATFAAQGAPVRGVAPSGRLGYSLGMTRLLPPTDDGLAEAVRLLGEGRLIGMPTETVYGLAADATDASAVAGIYAAKGRPQFNPLISHVADLAAALREGVFDDRALRLAHAFWPGPLTLVVPRADGGQTVDLARAGLDSIGLRVPSHPLAQRLLRAFGRPVSAPSANRSGHVSPTTAAHVLADLDGRIDAVLDGGAAEAGLESTIVGCVDGKAWLLRAGVITRTMLAEVIGEAVCDPDRPSDDNTPLAPGRLSAHYAPNTPVRLNAAMIRPGEAALCFGMPLPAGHDQAIAMQQLSESGNLVEAASRLYDSLRKLDKIGACAIAIAKIPSEGLGEAINDRLKRAAYQTTGLIIKT